MAIGEPSRFRSERGIRIERRALWLAEDAAAELRHRQEEEEGDILPDQEPIDDSWERYARQWREGADAAAENLGRRESAD